MSFTDFTPFGFDPRRSSSVDPFSVDPFYSDLPYPRFRMAVADARVNWEETCEARVFKADLSCRKKRGVKVEVGGSSVQIRGERTYKREKKTDTRHRCECVKKTDTRHRVEREKKIEIRHCVEREKTTETWHRVERGKKTETWHCVEREKKTETWQREKKTDTRPRVAREKKTDSGGEVLRRFRLPANVKADQVEVAMQNRMLTVTVPKKVVKKPSGKSIKIYG
ncbi:18.1 kDa class I heat shock protein-like [Zingiber officinale]|uniref:18.1 kDa class I heat shock protein-like n=1 Tax=Zingiber officinale TaxID=94328 RepID=UPI001C4D668D|nr:18.1 kDa class I heat shock protein-like [Zingiber officinale]